MVVAFELAGQDPTAGGDEREEGHQREGRDGDGQLLRRRRGRRAPGGRGPQEDAEKWFGIVW